MPLQDWGLTCDELEPYYENSTMRSRFGKTGNLKGQIRRKKSAAGARQKEYPLPPLKTVSEHRCYSEAARAAGYHPFASPAANASQAYTNPDGARFGACQYCGHCERFGCEANAKGSPHIAVIPIALRDPNVELRTRAWVTKVNLDSSGKHAKSVTYVDVMTGEEFEQPAGLVVLCAYALWNTHLMLLSGIGKPYDPKTGKGVVGKNYAYQVNGSVTLFFEDKFFNPFMGAGALASRIDDFHANEQFDTERG